MSYIKAKEHLVSLLDDLFGDRNMTEDEFVRRDVELGKKEEKIVEAGWLTWEQIMAIEETWTPTIA